MMTRNLTKINKLLILIIYTLNKPLLLFPLSTLFIKFLIVFDIYFEMNRPKNDVNTYCI